MTELTYILIVACICFFYTLNLLLRGKLKQLIEAVSGLLIVVSVIASFLVFGWRFGLVCLISPFILIGLFRPIAQALAYRLLGYRTGVDDQRQTIDKIFERGASSGKAFENALEEIDRLAEKNRQRLSSLARKNSISSVLAKHELSFDEYENLFNYLQTSSLHDLSWEIVSTANDLDSLIQMKNKGTSDIDIWDYFRNFR